MAASLLHWRYEEPEGWMARMGAVEVEVEGGSSLPTSTCSLSSVSSRERGRRQVSHWGCTEELACLASTVESTFLVTCLPATPVACSTSLQHCMARH